jgi:folate-binding protein YgfZ
MSHLPVLLKDRGVVEVSGPDASAFLQGLITNDMKGVADGRAIYAALLTPQGKIIHDFLLARAPGEAFWLDCVKANAADLAARLKKYKLRAKITIADRSAELHVVADGKADVSFEDPRLAALGRRAITAMPGDVQTDDAAQAAYNEYRLSLGVPDAATDIPPESFFPLDCNFEELHGVAFDKGCYIGQELTARMKHRATARRRMLPVTADVSLPPPGTTLKLGATDIGELRGSIGTHGMALVRLDRLGNAQEADAGGITVRVGRPAYPLILPTGDEP